VVAELPEDIEAQTRQAWRNIFAALAKAKMAQATS
jgi:enamine deaminase RidA (YjgF/YER057c/UK114 family)